MKRRAGEREKELKVPSLCFLLPFGPKERAHGELSFPRLLRDLWGCKGQGEPACAPAAPAPEREPRVRGLRGRREVYCEREAAQAPRCLPRSGSRGAAGGCRPAPPGRIPGARAGNGRLVPESLQRLRRADGSTSPGRSPCGLRPGL